MPSIAAKSQAEAYILHGFDSVKRRNIVAYVDGVLAAFAAGLVLSRFLPGELDEQRSLFHATIRRFFELPVFFILGVVLPFGGWAELGWRAWIFVVAVLFLRRLPAVGIARGFIAPVETARDAWFVGWFGPIGVAALYYAAMAARQTGEHEIWTLTSLVVTASVVAHGVTGTALTERYGRAAVSHR
jgi:NhaP-type Na+/H+ or K+/H+ antiporter